MTTALLKAAFNMEKNPVFVKPYVQYGYHLALLAENFPQQSLGLPLQRQNVGPYFFQCAHRLGFVEVAREADFVAYLDTGLVVPRIRCIGQHLSAQETLNAAFFKQRHLLGVAQFGVVFVLDDAMPAVHGGFNPIADRVGIYVSRTMEFLFDGLGGLVTGCQGSLKQLFRPAVSFTPHSGAYFATTSRNWLKSM